MTTSLFSLAVGDEILVGDTLAAADTVQALFLHGAGQSDRQRQHPLREALALHGFGSAAFDFSGHGDSSANSPGSLEKRLLQAQQVLQHVNRGSHVHTLVGTSMSGEIAIRLACASGEQIRHIVLIVGAIYDRSAFTIPFGPAFSAAIRRPHSWRTAEVLELIASYRGALTLVRALNDTVIPYEIADLLAQAACAARWVRIIDLAAVDHRISATMTHDDALRGRIAAAIMENDHIGA